MGSEKEGWGAIVSFGKGQDHICVLKHSHAECQYQGQCLGGDASFTVALSLI